MAKKKLSKGQKPAAESAGAPQAPESGAAGRELAVPGRNGGTLIRHPEGSNGGVHRGPDRQLRVNAVRSILMEALAKEGVSLVVEKGRRRRRHRSKIPMALVTNLVTRIQEIAFTGSDGDVLRLVFGMHDVFQPGRHEKNGGNGYGPKPATFVVAPPTAPPTEQPPARETASGTLLDANGQEYVSA
jgi:hypothetical protein